MSTDDAAREWDAEAPAYDDEADHGLRDPRTREAWGRVILPQLPEPPSRIAEMGAGTGSLTLLMAEAGHAVDGIDVSPAMLERARTKTAGFPGVRLVEGDASAPPLAPGEYDALVCRHVLWALPDPAAALARWFDLLRPGGRLVLVEGFWGTGAGLRAAEVEEWIARLGPRSTVQHLGDPALWGRQIADERYLLTATRAG